MVEKIYHNHFSEIMGRKKMKISQVSRDTGISRVTLTKLYYEKSKSISFDSVKKLCRYLECSFEDLFGDI